jgi:CheY-like chemotaxis protein
MAALKPLSGRCVIVVEDDYYLAEDTKAALEDAGASVVGPFPAAASALQAAEQHAADCAVMDVNLGAGPNFEPAQRLLELGVPVVFVTGYDSSVIPDALSHLPCLQKPADARKLVAAVERLCAS